MVNYMKSQLKMVFNSTVQKNCSAVVRFASKFLVKFVLSIKKFFPFLVVAAVLVTAVTLPCFALTPTSQSYRFWYFSRVGDTGFSVSNVSHLNTNNILRLSSSNDSTIRMGFWRRVPDALVSGSSYAVTVRYHNFSGHNIPITIFTTNDTSTSPSTDTFIFAHVLQGSSSIVSSTTWTEEKFSFTYNGENYLYFWVTSSGYTDLYLYDISFNYVNINEGVENRLDETNNTLNSIDDTLNGEGEDFTMPTFPDMSFESTYNDDFADAFDGIKDNFSTIEQDSKIRGALTGFKVFVEGFFDGVISNETIPALHPWFMHLVWFFVGISLFGFIINIIGTGVSSHNRKDSSKQKGGKHK